MTKTSIYGDIVVENEHGLINVKKNRKGRTRLKRRRVGKTERLVKKIYGNDNPNKR